MYTIYGNLDILSYCDERRDTYHEMQPESEGFLKGLNYISPYLPTEVILQILSISKNYTSSMVLPGWAIFEESMIVFYDRYSCTVRGREHTHGMFPMDYTAPYTP